MEKEKNSFIDATVNRIVDFLSDKKCYLLADETGLGKTIETRELIGKWYNDKYASKKSEKEFKVLYIAPNLILAKKNIKKLVHSDLAEKTQLLETMRLSQFGSENDTDKKVKYWAITPAVSFFLEGGTREEIGSLSGNKDKILEKQEEIKKKLEICEEAKKSILNKIGMNAKEDNELFKALNELYDDFLFFAEIETDLEKPIEEQIDNKVVELKEKIVEMALVSRKKVFRQFVEDEWLKDVFVYHYIDKDNENNQELDLSVQQFREMGQQRKDILCKTFCKMLIERKEMLCNNKCLKSEIDNVKDKSKEEYFDNKIKSAIQSGKIVEKDYFVETFMNTWKVYEEVIMGLSSQSDFLKNCSKERIKKDLKESLKDVIIGEKTSRTKELDIMIRMVLYSLYTKLYEYYLRLAGCIYNVRMWEPDLVIFDEFQNYPKLFKQCEEGSDKSTNNVQKILNAVSENSKVLMLSATPYAYHNMIPSREQEMGEEERFLSHIGMEDILSYMNKYNDVKVDYSKIFIEYHELLKRLESSFDVMDETEKENTYNELCEKAKGISDILFNAGISRNERPAANYNLEGKNLYISPKDVMTKDNSTDIYTAICGSNDEAVMTRRFLSIPIYGVAKKDDPIAYTQVAEINEKLCKGETTIAKERENAEFKYRVRTAELLKDIFEQELVPTIFIPPIVPQYELRGPFAEKNNYSKYILFSAYTSVPDLLAEIVNEKMESLLEDVEAVDTKENPEEFHKYVENILNSISDIDKDDIPSIVGAIKSKFSNETSSKIIVKTFKKYGDKDEEDISPKNYWKKVKKYCEWGNFKAVIEEFIFLIREEKQNDKGFKLSAYLGTMDNEKQRFAVSYSSKSRITEKELEKHIDLFQSPFYPFCFFLSSVAQEGLDFHWYCDKIVHWNVPATPIAMLQREGRINRYRCYSLRKQLKKELEEHCTKEEFNKKVHNMKELFLFAEENSGKFSGFNGFYPNHLSVNNKALPINRKCYYYPLSEEYFRWKDLVVNMEFYRSLFGGWERSERISEDMMNYIRKKEKEHKGSIMVNISPSARKQ